MTTRLRKRKSKKKTAERAVLAVVLIGVLALIGVGINAFLASNSQGCPDSVPQITDSTALAIHIHVHLDVFVNGSSITVPSTLGHLPSGNLCALHTHDGTGIIHIESPTVQTFTLKQVIDVWGYQLPSGSTVYINGQVNNDLSYTLIAHDEIAIVSGTPPINGVPSSYNFPAGV